MTVPFACFHSVSHEAFEITSVHSKGILERSVTDSSGCFSQDPDREPICTLSTGCNRLYHLRFSTSASEASGTEIMTIMYVPEKSVGIPGEVSLRISDCRCTYILSVMTH